MRAISSISLSGMQAAQTQLDVSAGNIANAQTENYQRRDVVQSSSPDGGVTTTIATAGAPNGGTKSSVDASLTTDIVTELQSKNAFLANLAVFKTADKMAGTLLDVQS